MSPELAALLDGPVSDRFGRPIDRCGIAYRLSGDEWSAYDNHGIDDPISAAIWLAHLLGKCGERGWNIQVNPPMAVSRLVIVSISQYEWNGDDYACREAATILEALTRAMLAVPTEDRP